MSTQSLLARGKQRKERRLQENQTQFSSPLATPGSATAQLPPLGGTLGFDSSPNPFSNGASAHSALAPSMHLGIPLTQLKNFGERALKRYKLSDESEAEFKRYLEVRLPPTMILLSFMLNCAQTSTKDERDVLQFIHTLRTEDMLAKSTEERVENWTPSTKLAVCSSTLIYTVII